MSNVPASIGYITVNARGITAFADSDDVGNEPDARPMLGAVTFTPHVGRKPIVAIAENPKYFVAINQIETQMDSSGFLRPPGDGENPPIDDSGSLRLIAPDQPDALSVFGWTWTATFRPGDRQNWESFSVVFSGAPGETIDLVDLYLLNHPASGGEISSAATVIREGDPRLSDARVPVHHTHSMEDIEDYEPPNLSEYAKTIDIPREPSDIGAAPASQVVVMPDGFPALPCTFTTTPEGVEHDMDFTPYRTAPTHMWVAPGAGSDNNEGTEARPINTMNKVWALTGQAAGDVVIHIKPGRHLRSHMSLSSPPTVTGRRVSIIGEGPDPVWVTAGESGLSWANDSGAWKASRTFAYGVYSTTPDSYGNPVPLAWADTTADCRTTPDSWHTDGTYVWVNTGGSAPTQSTHVVTVVSNVSDITIGAGGALYLENLGFLTPHGVTITGTSLDATVIANRVRYVGGDHRGGSVSGNALSTVDANSWLFECHAAYSARDGFNYHASGVPVPDRKAMLVLEAGCVSYENGMYNTERNNNATSAHDGVSVARFGSQGWNSSGPVLADVGGCDVVLVGCWMRDSSATPASPLYHFGDSGGTAWLMDCRGGGAASVDLNADVDFGPVYLVGSWRGHRLGVLNLQWLNRLDELDN